MYSRKPLYCGVCPGSFWVAKAYHSKMSDDQDFLLSCVAQLPRSTHFAYIGDELQTPRQVNVLAKKEKKRRMIKSARQGLKSDLEDKLKEERLKEDIQDAIEMVRKRLHLKEKDVVNLNLSIDYLLSNTIPFSVISKMCSVAPRTFLLEIPV